MFFLRFIPLILKCIYNFPSFQSYIDLYIETRGRVSFTGGVVLYLELEAD
jgi:hypothetical protein